MEKVLSCGLYFVYYMLGDKGLGFHDKLVTSCLDNPSSQGKGHSPRYVGEAEGCGGRGCHKLKPIGEV